MQIEQTSETAEIKTSAAGEEESSSPTGSTPPSGTEAPAVTPAEGETPTPPAYTPNYEYTVLKEKKSIPEWARSAIKDAETEKQVRDIFERADGLDSVKSHRDQLQQEREYFQKEIVPFVQEVKTTLAHRDRGDLQTFFEKLGLSDTEIFEYARRRIELKNNPQLYAVHEQNRQEQLRTMTLEQQNAYLMSNYENLVVQQRTMELDSYLGRPEILPGVQAFESRLGQPGAFREEVIMRGQRYAANGKDVSVDTVVQEVLRLSGWSPQNTATPPATARVETPQHTPPPTLPNIKGSGSSPAKALPRSVDDLRRIAKQMG